MNQELKLETLKGLSILMNEIKNNIISVETFEVETSDGEEILTTLICKKNMLTKEEFIKTKSFVNNLSEHYSISSTSSGLIYEEGYYIEVIENGQYMLNIVNSSEISYYLNEFEDQLYELYKDNQ